MDLVRQIVGIPMMMQLLKTIMLHVQEQVL
jgi:hypothetical protein